MCPESNSCGSAQGAILVENETEKFVSDKIPYAESCWYLINVEGPDIYDVTIDILTLELADVDLYYIDESINFMHAGKQNKGSMSYSMQEYKNIALIVNPTTENATISFSVTETKSSKDNSWIYAAIFAPIG